ncbi:winged helix-turn-helix domain-containing protein [Beduini massiliensis]|uniref:winged helix-turn-helix domain-containing protein n=1 Tax=Beduini massiliensis TaxID=1585974 RepID=UPI00059AA8EF|nr:winged helix-turn-helix domain-containing protein [Beduini massiliensis]
MWHKQTLFDYVYDSLKEQILTKRFNNGEKLPSVSQMMEIYHVGKRTVKNVIHRLKTEGYIIGEERKGLYVVYQGEEDEHLMILLNNQKSSIIQAYQTLAIILPLFLSFSLTQYKRRELSELAKHYSSNLWIKQRNPKRLYQSCIHEIFNHSNNPLYYDFICHIAVYAKLSFLNQENRIGHLLFNHPQKEKDWFFHTLLLDNKNELIERFSALLNEQTLLVEKMLSETIKTTQHNALHENLNPFYWNIHYGQDHFYMQIVHDIIDKISLKEYPLNGFLPSEKKLAEYYQVGLSTVRSALSLLNKLGYAETINGQGTRIMLQDEVTAQKCMNNRWIRKNTILYLNALQCMIIILPPACRMSFDFIEDSTKTDLIERSLKQNHIFIDDLYQCLIDHISLQPYQEILIQLREICRYGYYYSFFKNGIESEKVVADKSKKVLQFLLDGEKEAFTREFTSCFQYILEFVREHIINYGLLEARKIKIPMMK